MRAALLTALVAVAGCSGSAATKGAVNLTVVVDDSVTADLYALLGSLSVQVSGDETFSQEFPIAGQWQDRKVGLVYKYKLTQKGRLGFAGVAGPTPLMPLVAGYTEVDIDPPNGTSATVILRSDIDFGDGGAPDLLPPPDLTPPPKKLGETCAAGVDVCDSGFCADGVCCNTACADDCTACNLASSKGTCSPIAAGDDPLHGTCPALAADDLTKPCSTDGKCDGSGQCRVWAANTVCKPESCDPSSNVHTPAALCDGAGRCIDVPTEMCNPYKCNGAACYGTCTGTGTVECSPPNSCVSASCGKLPAGRNCSNDNQCTSGICTDGLCCDARCTGQCEACDADATKKGKCLPIPANQPPRAGNGRTACAGSGTCGGTCDGTTRTVCKYPTSAVACRAQDCQVVGGVPTLTQAANCDGIGGCPLMTSSCVDLGGHPQTIAKCTGIACDYTDCAAGYGRCAGELGCNEQLTSDPANCGSCGNKCPASNQICSGSTCTCPAGVPDLCDTSSPPICFKGSASVCCRPNGQHSCSCSQTSGSCHLQCGPKFCTFICTPFTFACGVGDCGIKFIDSRFNQTYDGGQCYSPLCYANGTGGFTCPFSSN